MADNLQNTDALELRAAEQRRRLHESVQELKWQLRERMDVKKNARQYFWPAAGVAAFFGLLMGYGTSAMFVK